MPKIQPSIVTIITDCGHPEDYNVLLRQKIRYTSVHGCPTEIFYATDDRTAAGLLVEAVAAARGKPSLIVVNRADRSEHQEEWENGAPFGCAVLGNTLLVATPGPCLAKIGPFYFLENFLTFDLDRIFETPERFDLRPEDRWSQFRSYDLVPYLAKAIFDDQDVPCHSPRALSAWMQCIEDNQVWWIDKPFGNCKTFIEADMGRPGGRSMFEEGRSYQTTFGPKLPYYEQLARVPKGVPALVRGSSGLRGHHWIEVAVNGGSAAKEFGLSLGSPVFVTSRQG